MRAHASSSPPFEGLDDFAAALLLAKALVPFRDRVEVWAHRAAVLWGRQARSNPFGDAPAEASIAALVDRELVVMRDGARVDHAMRLDTTFAVLHEAAARGWLEPALARLEQARGVAASPWDAWPRRLGRARALLVLGQISEAMRLVERVSDGDAGRSDPLEPLIPWPVQLLGPNPPRAWLGAAADAVLVEYARGLGTWCSMALHPLSEALLDRVGGELQGRGLSAVKQHPVELLRAGILWLAPERSAPLLQLRGTGVRRKLEVLHAFVRGDLEAAYALGEALLEASKPNRGALVELEAFVFLLACLDAAKRGVPGAWVRFESVIHAERGGWVEDEAFGLLHTLFLVETGLESVHAASGHLEDAFDASGADAQWPSVLAGALIARWLELGSTEPLDDALARVGADAQGLASGLLPRTFRALRDPGAPTSDTLVDVYASRPAWEHMIDQLAVFADDVAPKVEAAAPPPFAPVIAWEVGEAQDGELEVTPRLIASPRSTGGRSISVREVASKYAHVADEHDAAAVLAYEQALAHAEAGRASSLGDAREQIVYRLVLGLVGHPRVRDRSGAPIRVVRESPRLVVDGDDTGARVFVEPESLSVTRATAHAWPQPHQLGIYEADERLGRVFRALAGMRGQRVPLEAVGRLRPTLTRLAGHLALEGRGSVSLDTQHVDSHAGIDVDLAWREPTLTVEVVVRPLGAGGPRCIPGQGEIDIVGDVMGGLRSATRDLDAEMRAIDAVMEACPRLAELEVDDHGGRFVVGLQRACALLEELTAAATGGQVSLGWPRGKPLRLSREYGVSDLAIEVRRGKVSWLALQGGVQLDEGQVATWRTLCAGRAGRNRFVRLASGQVLRLSDALRRKLDALVQLDVSPAGTPEEAAANAPEFLLPVLNELLGEARLELVGDVARRHDQIEAAFATQAESPAGLRASLRPYQLEGYRWMMRLAGAQLGAVLADDMGLGKTVQALAVLLSRAQEGPALVVCPTSVLVNWCAEAGRFAPALTMVQVGELPTDQRLATLEAIGPGEVAVMSYGVLSRLGEDAAGLHFDTVVFDEVHALKNERTSRARAASAVSANFRVGLTGTPVENHLGELWSVMHACVPGLLGDRVLFSEGLAKSVVEGSSWATEHLRALLRPFLLRRTKQMVLRELPRRTESVVMVEPSSTERAWYEAQRQLAADRIKDAKRRRALGKGQSRMLLLAEIGRLRRAAVEPRLVEDEAPRGAKLEQVVERTVQLISAGHRVLVFTQFLGVLAILQARLNERGVVTLELQGATPGPERARRIDAFQAGHADVFLMSLKAGGIGVNLTAADYVIHVDPWWNPAVEDQATGRAHRMGQTRPVTVYRYCTAGTIETKILALHESKRELAADVLEGMSERKSLDLDELGALLSRG